MVICKDLEHIQYFDESALTIGSLDGMHKGHIGIISNLIVIGKKKFQRIFYLHKIQNPCYKKLHKKKNYICQNIF